MIQQEPDDNAVIARSGSKYEDEIDLIDYIKVAYKHRRMIAAIVLISMFFAGVSSLMKPKTYKAQATFFPMNTNYNIIQSQGVVMEPRLDIEDLIISILESRKMADRIIEQLDLKKVWNQKLISDTRIKLNKASKVSLGKNGIIKLSVQTKSPKLSSKIANTYVDNLDYFNKELNLGAQRNIVQVIDRATIPEVRMPRGTVKNAILAAIASFMFAIFLAFFIKFIQNSDLKNRLKED